VEAEDPRVVVKRPAQMTKYVGWVRNILMIAYQRVQHVYANASFQRLFDSDGMRGNNRLCTHFILAKK
jgi:hypothetical protein